MISQRAGEQKWALNKSQKPLNWNLNGIEAERDGEME